MMPRAARKKVFCLTVVACALLAQQFSVVHLHGFLGEGCCSREYCEPIGTGVQLLFTAVGHLDTGLPWHSPDPDHQGCCGREGDCTEDCCAKPVQIGSFVLPAPLYPRLLTEITSTFDPLVIFPLSAYPPPFYRPPRVVS